MRVDAFDFELPPERIALHPASPRDSARMLVVGVGGALTDASVRDLPDFLRPGDALAVNDTRVIAARLDGIRVRGDAVAAIEATLIKRVDDCRWRALVRPAKKLKIGERVRFGETSESMACLLAALDAEVEEKGEAGEALLRFEFAGAALDEAIERLGAPPLPPYIAARRAPEERTAPTTRRCSQRNPGPWRRRPRGSISRRPSSTASALAASCCIASLCMSAPALSSPSRSRTRATTRCMRRTGAIDAATAEALNAVRDGGGRIVCVGTTSARILESAADERGRIRPFAGETSIFITPGYRFRAVDALMTNFHLPRSTLFMLVSAFSGLETMRRAYAHAI